MKQDQAKKVDTLKQQAIAEKQETVENLQKKLQECKSSINAYKEDIEKLTNEVENLKKKRLVINGEFKKSWTHSHPLIFLFFHIKILIDY